MRSTATITGIATSVMAAGIAATIHLSTNPPPPADARQHASQVSQVEAPSPGAAQDQPRA